MKKWKILIDCILLCFLISLVACRFAPFGSYGDSADYSAASTIAGFTPEQIQQVVDDIKNNKATLPVSLAVPAYSFYRFDYSNAAGGHRGSTILSYDQAIASPPYGVETTARVLIYEAMKAKANYSFDYFAFSDSLSKDRIGSVINAIAVQFSDTEFLLNSKQNIGSTTLVAQAVDELVNGLPLPVQADFVPLPIASPAVDLNLRPDFSDLPVTTLTTLFLNEDLHAMYASMTVVGLANYSLFTSNVQAVSQPRPSFRLHKEDPEHDITTNYRVSLAPISVDGSVIVNLASPSVSIPGVASSQMTLSSSGDNQRIVFTYSGDRAIPQMLTADSEKLILSFTYRDLWDDNCDSSKRKSEGPIVYLNMAGPQKFAGESHGFTTPVAKLLCVVIVDNQPVATFTAEQGVPASVDLPIPAGRVATLSCSIIPPTIQVTEASAKTALLAALASESRPLDALENASWNKACDASTSVEIPDLGRSIFVPTMFKTWFRPEGTYVYLSSPGEFTPQVFREVAAPVSPSITLDMSRYSEAPLYAFSIAICPAPAITGIASGVFKTSKIFSIQALDGDTCEYSLDKGVTWNDYSGPVTLSTQGIYQIVARSKVTNFISAIVPVTIDTTAPQAPNFAGITSGDFASEQIFTVSGQETGGTLYYSLDNGVTKIAYTGQVTISLEGTFTVTAWQVDDAGNEGARAEPILVTIAPTYPAPTVTAVQPSAGANNAAVENVQINGTGFIDGAVVRLTLPGQESVTASPVTFNSSSLLTCTFNLTGKFVGSWNIEVTNPDGKTATGTDMFAVNLPVVPPPAEPAIAGIATGTFSEPQTFTVIAAQAGGSMQYSLDNGTTWTTYLESVTIATDGVSIVTARQIDDGGLIGSAAAGITVTIDRPAPPPAAPTITGITTGAFNAVKTFSIQVLDGETYDYSIDNGSTWNDYSGPVPFSTEGTYQVIARNKATNSTSELVTVTIDTTAPQAPTIAGIITGTYATSQTFTVSGAELGGTLYYSLDNGLNNTIYTEPVTISLVGIATCTAWQIDAAGNTGEKAASITVTIEPASIEPVAVTAIQPASGINNGFLSNVQITGTGFDSGAIPCLTRSGQAEVIGTEVVVNSSSTLTCSFDLTELIVGSWSVSVTNVDGRIATGTDIFTVQSKTWRKSLGGSLNDSDIYCVNAVDGGVFLAGTTFSNLGQESFISGASDIWIAKLDDMGVLLWSKCIGGTGTDQCSGLIAIGNGYVLAGDTTSMDGIFSDINISSGQKAMLLKIDANGDFDSTTPGVCPAPISQLPFVSGDARGGVKATSDGGYILAGACSDGSYGYAWTVKFDSAFSQEWDVRLACNSGNAFALDVAQKTDGNYLLCGYTEFGAGDFDYLVTGYSALKDGFVFEINTTGSVVNKKCFGGSGDDSCTGVIPLANGDFYVIGTTGSSDDVMCPLPEGHGTADVKVFKVTADFATSSIPLVLGGSGVDTGLRGQLDTDGGLLFSGQTTSTDGYVSGNHGATGDFWLGKVSSAGSLQWQKCFGGTADDFISGFLTTSDGGYLLSGYGRSTDGDLTDTGHQIGNDDFVIIRESTLPASIPIPQ